MVGFTGLFQLCRRNGRQLGIGCTLRGFILVIPLSAIEDEVDYSPNKTITNISLTAISLKLFFMVLIRSTHCTVYCFVIHQTM